jgi:hypothetical protein
MDQIGIQTRDMIPEVQQRVVVGPLSRLQISEVMEWRLLENLQTAQGDNCLRLLRQKQCLRLEE